MKRMIAYLEWRIEEKQQEKVVGHPLYLKMLLLNSWANYLMTYNSSLKFLKLPDKAV